MHMNLIPRNSVFDFDTLFNDVGFNDLFHGFGRPAIGARQPQNLAGMRVDIHDADALYEIHAELPGVKKKDISITLHDGVLTISASKNTESEKKEKGKVIWKERSSGSITRSFTVGRAITEKDIKANFNDGVLTLEVPKTKDPNGKDSARQIPIK